METYEQKYKEALERARLLKLANPDDEAIQTFVKDSFPELRESENERIRKKIISAMSYYRNDGCISEYEFGVCRNWIEKQKEQKPVGWSEEDEKMRIKILEALSAYADHMQYEGLCNSELIRGELMGWLKSLRPQPHWKPTEEQKPETKLTRWVVKERDEARAKVEQLTGYAQGLEKYIQDLQNQIDYIKAEKERIGRMKAAKFAKHLNKIKEETKVLEQALKEQ